MWTLKLCVWRIVSCFCKKKSCRCAGELLIWHNCQMNRNKGNLPDLLRKWRRAVGCNITDSCQNKTSFGLHLEGVFCFFLEEWLSWLQMRPNEMSVRTHSSVRPVACSPLTNLLVCKVGDSRQHLSTEGQIYCLQTCPSKGTCPSDITWWKPSHLQFLFCFFSTHNSLFLWWLSSGCLFAESPRGH